MNQQKEFLQAKIRLKEMAGVNTVRYEVSDNQGVKSSMQSDRPDFASYSRTKSAAMSIDKTSRNAG